MKKKKKVNSFLIFQMIGSNTETWNVSIPACPTGFDPGQKHD
jgi:hypothetical protein